MSYIAFILFFIQVQDSTYLINDSEIDFVVYLLNGIRSITAEYFGGMAPYVESFISFATLVFVALKRFRTPFFFLWIRDWLKSSSNSKKDNQDG